MSYSAVGYLGQEPAPPSPQPTPTNVGSAHGHSYEKGKDVAGFMSMISTRGHLAEGLDVAGSVFVYPPKTGVTGQSASSWVHQKVGEGFGIVGIGDPIADPLYDKMEAAAMTKIQGKIETQPTWTEFSGAEVSMFLVPTKDVSLASRLAPAGNTLAAVLVEPKGGWPAPGSAEAKETPGGLSAGMPSWALPAAIGAGVLIVGAAIFSR